MELIFKNAINPSCKPNMLNNKTVFQLETNLFDYYDDDDVLWSWFGFTVITSRVFKAENTPKGLTITFAHRGPPRSIVRPTLQVCREATFDRFRNNWKGSTHCNNSSLRDSGSVSRCRRHPKWKSEGCRNTDRVESAGRHLGKRSARREREAPVLIGRAGTPRRPRTRPKEERRGGEYKELRNFFLASLPSGTPALMGTATGQEKLAFLNPKRQLVPGKEISHF